MKSGYFDRLVMFGAATLVLGTTACGSEGADMYGAQYSGPVADYQEGEQYSEWVENDFVDASIENVSTFSVDVDNASYTIMRRDIMAGNLPAPQSVRPEEYINYFSYAYPAPVEHPFSINLEAAPSVFGGESAERPSERKLLRIGLRGKHIDRADIKRTNLVFLVDTSGSMTGDKIELVQDALRILVDNLRPQDTVGITTYAGSSETPLAPTPIGDKSAVRRGIDDLGDTGGSTNGHEGIVTAYAMLESVAVEGANNRVIVLTDGDFNVGKTGDELIDFIAGYREKQMSLTMIGVGRGNINDATMEGLAQEANGNYFYIDSVSEANRVFGTKLASTIEVIAADVKVQVEFDPAVVETYRLLGYENRVLDNEDFDDDTKDAGEIGPDHRVTALYEIELNEEAQNDSLLARVRVRYKEQYGDDSTEFGQELKVSNLAGTFTDASADFRFAAAVAEYAEILRESRHSTGRRLPEVLEIAADAADQSDPEMTEFIRLVGIASMIH